MNPFSLEVAQGFDQEDPLSSMRDQFYIPKEESGNESLYFCGNSLGLQPKCTQTYVEEELEAWKRLGVKGHFQSKHPWMPYHEFLTEGMAAIVGAQDNEVVVMNTLTANLHFMMVSFYQPTPERHKILIESHAFPSDHYAVESQIRFHGFDPQQSLIQLEPRQGRETLRSDDILEVIEREGDSIALILLPGVQYYTGQVFDMQSITEAGHRKGCRVGFDLAHAAGNVAMKLHEWDVDFACWCTYKYLNSGPGSVAGCFVHERHVTNTELPRFAGWWGHDKQTRFQMGPHFQPIPTAEGWQLSNPPILSLAAIRASLDVFQQAGGIEALCSKSEKLSYYLETLILQELAPQIKSITPSKANERGCQFSLQVTDDSVDAKSIFHALEAAGIIGDWREPNVIRIAPVPLYNRFEELYHFVAICKEALGQN